MRYLFLIFVVFLLAGCGGEARFHANPIPDDEEVTDFDGETQTDIDDTQVDQIDNDADEPVDDSESTDDIDVNDVEQFDEDEIIPDPDIVVEDDIDEEPDDETPDEIVDDEPDEDVEPSKCGNGIIDAGEQCDPNFHDTVLSCVGRVEMMGDNDNSEQTAVTGGNIICKPDCSMDFSQCQVHPHFKIVSGPDKTAALLYIGPNNDGVGLSKKTKEFADTDMLKSQCSPVRDLHNIGMRALNYYMFRSLINNSALSNKIKNTCKLTVGTDYPDKNNQSYLTEDLSGRDQFKEDCYDESNIAHIFQHQYDSSHTYLLNDFMELYSPQTVQPDIGFYGVDFKKGMLFVHDDVLSSSHSNPDYRVMCSIRLIHAHYPSY